MNGATGTAGFNADRVPPQPAERSGWRFALPAALLLAAAGTGTILFFFDPGQHGFYPICYFHAATGLNCPGCGSLRAVHALLHGHVAEAARSNALLLLCLPFLVWGTVLYLARTLRQQPVAPVFRVAWLWLLLGVALVFTVLRNLPAFGWLAP